MINREKRLRNGGMENLGEEQPQSTTLTSKQSLVRRLKRGKEARAGFVESHLDKGLAFQIRSLRDQQKWTQGEFAQKVGIKHQNNVSARLENPNYGKHTLSTLKKIARACDVGLVVWFVPFSRLIDWGTGTPHVDAGLSPAFYDIPSFEEELKEGRLDPERKKKPVRATR
jgi:transcriptional regulator with XRE-family HTH domain